MTKDCRRYFAPGIGCPMRSKKLVECLYKTNATLRCWATAGIVILGTIPLGLTASVFFKTIHFSAYIVFWSLNVRRLLHEVSEGMNRSMVIDKINIVLHNKKKNTIKSTRVKKKVTTIFVYIDWLGISFLFIWGGWVYHFCLYGTAGYIISVYMGWLCISFFKYGLTGYIIFVYMVWLGISFLFIWVGWVYIFLFIWVGWVYHFCLYGLAGYIIFVYMDWPGISFFLYGFAGYIIFVYMGWLGISFFVYMDWLGISSAHS